MRSARLPRLPHSRLRRAIIHNSLVGIGYIVYSAIIGSGNFYIFICGTSYTFFDDTPYVGFIGDGTFFSGLFYFGFITNLSKHTTKFDYGRDPSGHRACHRRLRDHR